VYRILRITLGLFILFYFLFNLIIIVNLLFIISILVFIIINFTNLLIIFEANFIILIGFFDDYQTTKLGFLKIIRFNRLSPGFQRLLSVNQF